MRATLRVGGDVVLADGGVGGAMWLEVCTCCLCCVAASVIVVVGFVVVVWVRVESE